jgi:ATP-dependent Clp protease ATP-binding subunit ClpA
VELQLADLKATLAKQDIKLSIAEPAMDWLAQKGYHPEFGARPLSELFKREY